MCASAVQVLRATCGELALCAANSNQRYAPRPRPKAGGKTNKDHNNLRGSDGHGWKGSAGMSEKCRSSVKSFRQPHIGQNMHRPPSFGPCAPWQQRSKRRGRYTSSRACSRGRTPQHQPGQALSTCRAFLEAWMSSYQLQNSRNKQDTRPKSTHSRMQQSTNKPQSPIRGLGPRGRMVKMGWLMLMP